MYESFGDFFNENMNDKSANGYNENEHNKTGDNAFNSELNDRSRDIQCGVNSTVQNEYTTQEADGDFRAQIQWERRLLDQERELLRRERDLFERERRINQVEDNKHVHYRHNAMQVIPEFDPGKLNSTLNALQWVAAAENLANIFKWDKKTLLFNAITKLSGAAKMWFEGVQQKVYDWDSFKQQLILDFPTANDDADIHFELSKRRKKWDESYENYVYHMKAIAAKGNFNEHTVLKYIIAGFTDKDIGKLLAISSPHDTHDLLIKIKNYESTMRNVQSRPPTTSNASSSRHESTSSYKTQGDITKKCFNCNEIGHISIKCQKPQRKMRCFKCDRVGHIAKDCSSRNMNQNSSSVNKIEKVIAPLDPYHKIIIINDQEIIAFIDLGSEVVTIRETDACRLKCKYEPCQDILRGFGGGKYKTIGKYRSILKIDEIDIETEMYVVPNKCQEDVMIIGRRALDPPGIKIT